jgi:hypothetical protein
LILEGPLPSEIGIGIFSGAKSTPNDEDDIRASAYTAIPDYEISSRNLNEYNLATAVPNRRPIAEKIFHGFNLHLD